VQGGRAKGKGMAKQREIFFEGPPCAARGKKDFTNKNPRKRERKGQGKKGSENPNIGKQRFSHNTSSTRGDCRDRRGF